MHRNAASAPQGTSALQFVRMPARLLEIVAVIVLAACGLMLFFGPAIKSGFALYPGDLGDWRFNGAVAEHWFAVLTGREQWRDPIYYFPVKGMLGYSDALFLFVPFYVPFRIVGIEPSLAFVFCFMAVLTFGFFSAYWFVARTLALPKLLALGLSFAFVFSNMASMRYPHAQLYSSCFLPALFAMGLSFAKAVLTQRAGILPGVGFSVGLAALLYTGFYIGYFVILFLLCFIPLFVLVSAWSTPGSVREMARALWRARYGLLACSVCFLLALVPFMLTYFPVLKEVGARDWSTVACSLPLPRDFINVDGNAAWGWLQQNFQPETRPCGWELTFGFPLGTYAFVRVGRGRAVMGVAPAMADGRKDARRPGCGTRVANSCRASRCLGCLALLAHDAAARRWFALVSDLHLCTGGVGDQGRFSLSRGAVFLCADCHWSLVVADCTLAAEEGGLGSHGGNYCRNCR